MSDAIKPMRCTACGMFIEATIVQAKSHGWRLWVGGAQCKRCVEIDRTTPDPNGFEPGSLDRERERTKAADTCADAAIAQRDVWRTRAEAAEARALAAEADVAALRDVLNAGIPFAECCRQSGHDGESDVIDDADGNAIAWMDEVNAMLTKPRPGQLLLDRVASLEAQVEVMRVALEDVVDYHGHMVHGQDCPIRLCESGDCEHADEADCEEHADECECCLGVALVASRALSHDAPTKLLDRLRSAEAVIEAVRAFTTDPCLPAGYHPREDCQRPNCLCTLLAALAAYDKQGDAK